MDTQLALDVFINAGLMDTTLSKDVVEEMANSGKELWETLLDFGIISSPEDFWNVIATEVGANTSPWRASCHPKRFSTCSPLRKRDSTEHCPWNIVKARVFTYA